MKKIKNYLIMGIHESGENYLETILLLKNETAEVRSIDIALKLNYSKASISRAMGLLKKAEYITIDKKGYIQFTQKGINKAKEIYDRHITLTTFLIKTLDLDKETAEEEACKMEHIISSKTFKKIKDYVTNKNL